MNEKTEKIKNLLKRLNDFQKDNLGFNKDSFEEWKKEVIEVLDEKQRVRFRKLKFYEIVDETFDPPF
jgi:hypothetical protein